MRARIKYILNWLGMPPYWVNENVREFSAMLIRIWGHSPMARARIRRILARKVIRLNFGCGETCYEGWCGIDQFFAPEVDLAIDLRRSLPFPDDSVDWCYSEHFFEHLYPEEGQRHLIEVERILKPRGRYRVVVPDVLKFAKHYLEGNFDFFRLAFPWAKRPMQALYCAANWNGQHRNILDYEELKYMGQIAGFTAAIESQANRSEIPDLLIDKADPQRVEESLYVEFIKRG
jgi:predicted SAM-dependent methyltransferase